MTALLSAHNRDTTQRAMQMPVNPAYQDFFKALDAIERGADAWEAYERYYLHSHREVVTAYWRQCWGADEEQLSEFAGSLRAKDYRALRENLATGEVEAIAAQGLAHCASLIALPEPQVDLLVGRFSPDAFLLEVGGEWHIGVGLERFAHFSGLPLFIAHEYGHYARRLLAPEPVTLGDHVVAEGFAVAFAQTAYPAQPLTRHLRMSPRRLHEIRELEPRLWAALAPHLSTPYEAAFAGIIAGGGRWMDFPPRFGACLGYFAVRHFARAKDASPASREVLAASSEAMLTSYVGSTPP